MHRRFLLRRSRFSFFPYLECGDASPLSVAAEPLFLAAQLMSRGRIRIVQQNERSESRDAAPARGSENSESGDASPALQIKAVKAVMHHVMHHPHSKELADS